TRFLKLDEGGAELGRTNYVGSAGTLGFGANATYNKYVGVLYNRSQVSLGQLTTQDGSSNTLLFGEALGGKSVQRDFAFSWIGCGALLTYYGLPQASNSNPDAEGWFHFSSHHPGVVQFCFADGSVRSLRHGSTAQGPPSPATDWWIFQELAGRQDGGTMDTS